MLEDSMHSRRQVSNETPGVGNCHLRLPEARQVRLQSVRPACAVHDFEDRRPYVGRCQAEAIDNGPEPALLGAGPPVGAHDHLTSPERLTSLDRQRLEPTAGSQPSDPETHPTEDGSPAAV